MGFSTHSFSLFFIAAAFITLPARGGDRSDHWAFRPVERPGIPDQGDAGSCHPIDSFVVARLVDQGLELSPSANPQTLLRRLHLDLTGLLPSPGEVADFLASWDDDPDLAYERKVDELLASPHFGERWARPWLDLARYADSDGYLGDTMRPWSWVYRDWVIDSINRDQPYDRFSIEQLAGDLIPGATEAQRIATGFHRNNLKNTEAGADRELDRTKRIVDRVATTGTAWLALSLACAECHDHKHDPISQEEFFQLYAFFNNSDDVDISVRIGDEWDAYEKRLKSWEIRLEELENELAGYLEKPRENELPKTEWKSLLPDKMEAASTDLKLLEDHSVVASGSKVPATVTYFLEVPIDKEWRITGLRIEAIGEFGEGRVSGEPAGRGEGGEFVLSMFFPDLIVGGKAKRIKLSSVRASQSDGGEHENLAETILPTNGGWRIARHPYRTHAAVFELAEPVVLPAGSRLKFSLGNKAGGGAVLRRFRLSATGDTGPLDPAIAPGDPSFESLRLPLERHLGDRPARPPTRAQAVAERQGDSRRTSFVHVRGDYQRRGNEVVPGTPVVLHPFTAEKRDRLALAHWLFDPGNPLTARVAVNQVWQELFGVGIVPTSDDFGTYGSPPTHPELLDWLACEFRERGWSRKSLIRSIVLSSTYRQSSRNTRPDLSNELLWRQNAFRLPADSVRDVHLVASGLFSNSIGGPGIRPPLPGFVTAVGRSVKWPVSQGDERFRRGLYIVLKRTVLYPMLTSFDAPDTSAACSRRERTNTPMQALTLLNDPVFFECAERLGKDALTGDDVEESLVWMFRACLNRRPEAVELKGLREAHDSFLGLSRDPEMAMIATARVIMNLDEFITRD